jgi:hypothetical protein
MDEDIEFDIAANDTASAVLRKLGDELQFLGENIGETTAKSHKLEVSMVGLGAVAASLAAAYGVLKGASAVGNIFGDAIDEFVEIEKASKRLDASLVELANTIESATNIDEKSILSLMQGAKGKGVAGDQIGEITKAAIGLAEVMNVSLTEAMNRAREATMGNFDAFQGLIPGINELSSQEAKLAAVTALATQGLLEKQTAAGSAISVFDRMNTELNNLYETVGEVIEPFRQLAYEGIAVVAELLTKGLTPAIEDFKGYFSGMAESLESTSQWIAESLVGAFTLVEVAVSDLSRMGEIIGASLLLPIEEARAGWEYTFTQYIPAALDWFFQQFNNIMSDIGTIAAGVFENIGDVASSVWDYILSGFSPEAYAKLMFDVGKAGATGFLEGSKPLTEGFEPPEFVESDWAQTLRDMLNSSTDSLTNEYFDKFNERMDALRDMTKGKTFDANLKLNIQGGTPEVKSIQATESRVMVRGSTEDPLLKISNEQLNALKRLEDILERNQSGKPTLVGII